MAHIATAGALNVGKDLYLLNDFGGGSGDDAFLTVAAATGHIGGNFFANHNGENAFFRFTATKAPFTIGGSLTANFTEVTSVDAAVSGLSVGGGFAFNTGASNDTLSIDDFSVKGATTILSGGGGDHVNIETLTTHAQRTSSFGKVVDIELAAGNDSVLIGVNGDATAEGDLPYNGQL